MGVSRDGGGGGPKVYERTWKTLSASPPKECTDSCLTKGGLWDIPPPGLCVYLIKEEQVIPVLRLVNKQWCSEVNTNVRHITLSAANVNGLDSDKIASYFHEKFPCATEVDCYCLDDYWMGAITNAFKDKLVSLKIGSCLCFSMDTVLPLSRLSKLQRVSFIQGDITEPHNAACFLAGALGGLEVPFSEEQNRCMNAVSSLTHLREFYNSGGVFTDLQFLAPLARLVDVELRKTCVTHFLALSGLTGLTRLSLASCSSFGDTHATCLSRLISLRRLELNCVGVTDAGVRYATNLSGLRWLSLLGDAVTEIGLGTLTILKELDTLVFDTMETSAGGLTHLTSFTELRTLRLTWPIDSEALRNVAKIKSLTSLRVDLGSISNAAFFNMTKLSALKELMLHREHYAGPVVTQWGHFALLRCLCLRGRAWEESSLAHLSRLTGLRELTILGKVVRDCGVRCIVNVSCLTRLDISCDGLSVSGARKFAGLRNLKVLVLRGKGVSQENRDFLQGWLPNCRIEWLHN